MNMWVYVFIHIHIYVYDYMYIVYIPYFFLSGSPSITLEIGQYQLHVARHCIAGAP
jgi:hypothetical protein